MFLRRRNSVLVFDSINSPGTQNPPLSKDDNHVPCGANTQPLRNSVATDAVHLEAQVGQALAVDDVAPVEYECRSVH